MYEEGRRRAFLAEISLFLLAPTVISAKLKLPKEVSFASVNPPTRPILPPQLIFFVSLPHFTLVRRPPHARHFFCLLPTNQAAKSSSDVAPTDKWSALRLPACGHYWSMRFSVFPPVFLSSFFTLPSPPPFFPHPVSSLYASFHRLSRCLYPHLPADPSAPVFTFYFTSRSCIIFLISRGYPFVRDNCRKWGGSGRVDGKRFFAGSF